MVGAAAASYRGDRNVVVDMDGARVLADWACSMTSLRKRFDDSFNRNGPGRRSGLLFVRLRVCAGSCLLEGVEQLCHLRHRESCPWMEHGSLWLLQKKKKATWRVSGPTAEAFAVAAPRRRRANNFATWRGCQCPRLSNRNNVAALNDLMLYLRFILSLAYYLYMLISGKFKQSFG